MPSPHSVNTHIFHASSIGRHDYLALAPTVPAVAAGCAIIYSGMNGNSQALAFTSSPVLLRPATLPAVKSVVVQNPNGTSEYKSLVEIAAPPNSYMPVGGWTTPVNLEIDRVFDANNVALLELADIVGSMIHDLIAAGIFVAPSGLPPTTIFTPQPGWLQPMNMLMQKAIDTDNETLQSLADVVATMIESLKAAGIFTT